MVEENGSDDIEAKQRAVVVAVAYRKKERDAPVATDLVNIGYSMFRDIHGVYEDCSNMIVCEPCS